MRACSWPPDLDLDLDEARPASLDPPWLSSSEAGSPRRKLSRTRQAGTERAEFSYEEAVTTVVMVRGQAE